MRRRYQKQPTNAARNTLYVVGTIALTAFAAREILAILWGLGVRLPSIG